MLNHEDPPPPPPGPLHLVPPPTTRVDLSECDLFSGRIEKVAALVVIDAVPLPAARTRRRRNVVGALPPPTETGTGAERGSGGGGRRTARTAVRIATAEVVGKGKS